VIVGELYRRMVDEGVSTQQLDAALMSYFNSMICNYYDDHRYIDEIHFYWDKYAEGNILIEIHSTIKVDEDLLSSLLGFEVIAKVIKPELIWDDGL